MVQEIRQETTALHSRLRRHGCCRKFTLPDHQGRDRAVSGWKQGVLALEKSRRPAGGRAWSMMRPRAACNCVGERICLGSLCLRRNNGHWSQDTSTWVMRRPNAVERMTGTHVPQKRCLYWCPTIRRSWVQFATICKETGYRNRIPAREVDAASFYPFAGCAT